MVLSRAIVGGTVCLGAAIVAAPARGGLLNLQLDDSPDIFASFIDVMYGAASEQVTASGFALTLDAEDITGGVFSIDATIAGGGVFSSGTLTIDGVVTGFGTTLLTADLVAFGFQAGGGDVFEFLFTVTGGDLATSECYGAPGTVVGVILSANGSNFTGSFALDFDNNGGLPGFGFGVSDTAPIPGPGTLLVIILGAGAVRARRRRAHSMS